MTDAELDILDADLRRRADSLWSALVGDAELFEQLREVLAELRSDARRHGGLELAGSDVTVESVPVSTIASPSSGSAEVSSIDSVQPARLMHTTG